MKPLKRIDKCLIITAIIVAAAISLTIKTPVFIQFLESKTFDIRFLLRGERIPGDEIVVVGIDDKSLEKIGRWPWSRRKIASLIKKISEGGARTIGLDIIFSEPEIGEGLQTIRDIKKTFEKKESDDADFIDFLNKEERKKDADEQLASAIRRAGNIILPFALNVPTVHEGHREGDVPEIIYNYTFMIVKEGAYHLPIIADWALLPLETHIRASASLGHVYTTYDMDGAIRWEPLYVRLKDSYYPSFGMEVVRHYLNLNREDMRLLAGEGIIMGDRFVSTDTAGRALINYSGRAGTFTTHSAIDVLEGKTPENTFKDKIVLIGTTALGTTDIHITPFFQLSGVEKQAAVIENIIHNRFLHRNEGTGFFNLAIIIIFGLIIVLLLPRLRALGGAIICSVLFLGYFIAAQYLFLKHGLWVDLLIPSFTVVLLYSSLTAYHFLIEEKKSREIRAMFSSYVTKKVVDELLKNPEMAKLGGQKRIITVLFSDVRGFTAFSEKREPEDVVSILNEFLAEMTDIILKWEGTLDKFVGDEIMAFWGAPMPQENQTELAIRCALNMIKRLSELQEKWVREGKEPLDIGIGINTGEVVVGNIGAEGKKMDYTIIGDNVNLGARVEALTRQYNTYIIITESTYEKIKDIIIDEMGKPVATDGVVGKRLGHVRINRLESVKVKGKKQAVMIFELIGNKDKD